MWTSICENTLICVSSFGGILPASDPWMTVTRNHWTDEGMENNQPLFSVSKFVSQVEMPLTVPKRLTIPIVEGENGPRSQCFIGSCSSCIFVEFLRRCGFSRHERRISCWCNSWL